MRLHEMVEQEEFWLRLLTVPHLSSAKLATLYHKIKASWSTIDHAQLPLLGLTPHQCQFLKQPNQRRICNAQHWLSLPGHRLLLLEHPDYPKALHALLDPPPILFVAGNVQLLNTPQLALVGSRCNTSYGAKWGSYFSAELTRIGFTITSGLAMGIDGICHRSALQAEGKTVAVLGNGLQKPYPIQHQGLAKAILAAEGTLISEFLPDSAPLPYHFPRRNRIMSGLSLGVLVVEATQRSGSLITARHALEQGREVFALPGPLESAHSQGGYQLIRQGGWLVSHPSEIVEQLHTTLQWLPGSSVLPHVHSPRDKQNATVTSLATLLSLLSNTPISVDQLAIQLKQPIAELLVQLTELELSGWIQSIPGGYIRSLHTEKKLSYKRQ